MKMMFSIILLLLPVLTVRSQPIPSDRNLLELGAGAGMASYADLNGYPGPKHVLEMRDTLRLTDDQEKNLEAIFDEMSENARAKGELIIAKEIELDAKFRLGVATMSGVLRLSGEIGMLRGELRAVHMTAHIQAKEILTKQQIGLYNAIRHKSSQHTSGGH